MSKKILTALLTLPSLLVSLLTGSAYAADKELIIGEPAPPFTLNDQHSRSHHLKLYSGKWLILYFYPKDDTPGCTKEACHFRDDIIKLKQLGAEILGVSLDDEESHKKFASKYSLQFPLLADTDGKVSASYGSLFSVLGIRFAKRHTFIIDPEGLIAKIYRDVDAESHSQIIIKDLTQLTQSRK